MARRLKLLDTHADLHSMIERWVIHTVQSLTGGLGYPRKSLDFSFVTSPASSVDPTGFAAQDFSDIEAALDKLAKYDRDLFAAIKMHYMPWTIVALLAEGYIGAPNQMFYDDLLRAHNWLASELRQLLDLRLQKNRNDQLMYG